MDNILRETKDCDCPQGFQLTQFIGGGTELGMSTLLLLNNKDNYPDRITTTFSVYPSPKESDVVVKLAMRPCSSTNWSSSAGAPFLKPISESFAYPVSSQWASQRQSGSGNGHSEQIPFTSPSMDKEEEELDDEIPDINQVDDG